MFITCFEYGIQKFIYDQPLPFRAIFHRVCLSPRFSYRQWQYRSADIASPLYVPVGSPAVVVVMASLNGVSRPVNSHKLWGLKQWHRTHTI